MMHIVFALLLSSARICAYSTEMHGAWGMFGSATNIKQHSKNVQILATLPPQTPRARVLRILGRRSIYSQRFLQAIAVQTSKRARNGGNADPVPSSFACNCQNRPIVDYLLYSPTSPPPQLHYDLT